MVHRGHDTNGRKAYVSYGSGNLIDDYKENKKYRYNCTLDVRPPELSDFIVSSSDVTNVTKENASSICANLGSGWRLPTGKEMNYVFLNAGTNGLPIISFRTVIGERMRMVLSL